MKANSARRFANRCHSSPGILPSSDPLPCTTSSCESGSTKFSEYAYISENVIWWWWYWRKTGSCLRYASVSCIQPMFHLNPKPSPPRCTGRETPGHAVDSSATVTMPGASR